jgi:hypothetical protein
MTCDLPPTAACVTMYFYITLNRQGTSIRLLFVILLMVKPIARYRYHQMGICVWGLRRSQYLDYVPSDDRMTGELEKIRKEAVVT